MATVGQKRSITVTLRQPPLKRQAEDNRAKCSFCGTRDKRTYFDAVADDWRCSGGCPKAKRNDELADSLQRCQAAEARTRELENENAALRSTVQELSAMLADSLQRCRAAEVRTLELEKGNAALRIAVQEQNTALAQNLLEMSSRIQELSKKISPTL
jgi:predicted RNase H-like nuclease (RuvC/YqgF family)